MVWTEEHLRAWVRTHLDRSVIRSCYLCERAEALGEHWSTGLTILWALRRFGLATYHADVPEYTDVPHAPTRCHGRRSGGIYILHLPVNEDRFQRLRDLCDS